MCQEFRTLLSNKKYTPVKIVSLFPLVFFIHFCLIFFSKSFLSCWDSELRTSKRNERKKGSQCDFTAVELRQRDGPRASRCIDETMTADVEKDQDLIFFFTVVCSQFFSDIDRYLCLLLRLCLFSGFRCRFNFLSIKFCYFFKFWTPVIQRVVIQFGMYSS